MITCTDHRGRIRGNIAGHMKPVLRHIQENAVKNFHKSDPEYGEGISHHLGFPAVKSRLWRYILDKEINWV